MAVGMRITRGLLGLSQPVDRPCVGATTSESYLFNFRLCVKKCCIKRDVRYTVMILPIIC
jgi:hypothetical protein